MSAWPGPPSTAAAPCRRLCATAAGARHHDHCRVRGLFRRHHQLDRPRLPIQLLLLSVDLLLPLDAARTLARSSGPHRAPPRPRCHLSCEQPHGWSSVCARAAASSPDVAAGVRPQRSGPVRLEAMPPVRGLHAAVRQTGGRHPYARRRRRCTPRSTRPKTPSSSAAHHLRAHPLRVAPGRARILGAPADVSRTHRGRLHIRASGFARARRFGR